MRQAKKIISCLEKEELFTSKIVKYSHNKEQNKPLQYQAIKSAKNSKLLEGKYFHPFKNISHHVRYTSCNSIRNWLTLVELSMMPCQLIYPSNFPLF